MGAERVPERRQTVNDDAARDLAERRLIAALKTNRDQLQSLLETASSHWGYEDPIYRFYHQSFKVYALQVTTSKIVEALRSLLPDEPLNARFEEIVAAGTGRKFTNEANAAWTANTRPIVEAFFHARFFLEMAVKYSAEIDEPVSSLPSGWAALLYLFNLR
jgi:phosphoenolpyruvate-protein kinase (PTS system EI component)